jgi:hypothetical protein
MTIISALLPALFSRPKAEPALECTPSGSWCKTTAVDPRNPHADAIPLAMQAPAELDHSKIQEGFEQLGAEAFRHATAAGFWHGKEPKQAVFEKLCLVVSEVGEAIEHLCYGRWETTKRVATEKETKEEGIYEVEEEGFLDKLADVVIRLCDLCWALKLDLAGAIIRKLYKNRRRPFGHGGRAF